MFAYCGNNPVNCSDPTGTSWINDLLDYLREKIEEEKEKSKDETGTKTVGFNFASAYGPASFASLGLASDKRGNIGIVISGGGGAGFPSTGVTIFATQTNAPTVEKLNGLGTQVGGSVTVLGGSVGAEYVLFADSDTGQGYQGITVSMGFSPLPFNVELHGEVGTSKVFAINVYDVMISIIDWLDTE